MSALVDEFFSPTADVVLMTLIPPTPFGPVHATKQFL
jgi:hypothetical protein